MEILRIKIITSCFPSDIISSDGVLFIVPLRNVPEFILISINDLLNSVNDIFK